MNLYPRFISAIRSHGFNRHNRPTLRASDRHRASRRECGSEGSLAVPLRLRRREDYQRQICQNRQGTELRLSATRAHWQCEPNTWAVDGDSPLSHLGGHEGEMPKADTQSMGTLWWARHLRLSGLASIRAVPRLGVSKWLRRRSLNRPDRQLWRLHAQQLPLGHGYRTGEQSPPTEIRQEALTCFADPHEGADFLRFKRRKAAA